MPASIAPTTRWDIFPQMSSLSVPKQPTLPVCLQCSIHLAHLDPVPYLVVPTVRSAALTATPLPLSRKTLGKALASQRVAVLLALAVVQVLHILRAIGLEGGPLLGLLRLLVKAIWGACRGTTTRAKTTLPTWTT
jgi:hypothetical protein